MNACANERIVWGYVQKVGPWAWGATNALDMLYPTSWIYWGAHFWFPSNPLFRTISWTDGFLFFAGGWVQLAYLKRFIQGFLHWHWKIDTKLSRLAGHDDVVLGEILKEAEKNGVLAERNQLDLRQSVKIILVHGTVGLLIDYQCWLLISWDWPIINKHTTGHWINCDKLRSIMVLGTHHINSFIMRSTYHISIYCIYIAKSPLILRNIVA